MPKGGVRVGAGRPKGKGPYGEATKPVRLPVSMLDEVRRLVAQGGYTIPLYSCKVQAGFPSPAEDSIEARIDLNTELVKNPASTFLVRATGDSMINVGIRENDLLIVDKSIEPANGKIAIVALDGQLAVKRLLAQNNKMYLISENDKYPPIEVHEESSFYIWGVVTRIIHMPYV